MESIISNQKVTTLPPPTCARQSNSEKRVLTSLRADAFHFLCRLCVKVLAGVITKSVNVTHRKSTNKKLPSHHF